MNSTNKNIIFKRIKMDSKNKCLIVYYDSISEQQFASNQTCKQIIKINKPANKNLNIQKIAKKVMKKSNIIPHLHYYDLVSELLELDRKCSITSIPYEYPLSMYNFLTFDLCSEVTEKFDGIHVSIKNLDNYTELLYDELEDKIKGAFLILKSISQMDCLDSLSKNDTLLCALSRVFREDGKKSLELSIYITCIFGYFSKYSDFHFAITNYKVGSTCLELIYYEMLREESWLKELNKAKESFENCLDLNINDKLTYEKLSLSHQNLVKKQNIFFRYSLYILLNISEDLKLEYKIFHKGIVSILGKLLERNNQELLLIVVLFLKKLSVFIEDKIQMKEFSIYKSVSPLLYLDNELLICNTLKLIYNLMIDRDIRIYFVRAGIFPKLISFFLKGLYISVLVSIFYLISCEHKFLPIFKNEQVINVLLEKLFQNVDYKVILNKLLTNMAINEDLAKMIINYNDFNEIIRTAILENNIHMLRLFRNISCHSQDCFKSPFINFVDNLFELMLQNSVDQSLNLIECSAILTNLSSILQNQQMLDWLSLFKKFSFYEFLFNFFKTNSNDKKSNSTSLSYLLLFVGVVASHQTKLSLDLIENKMIDFLLNLINLNQENDDIVSNAIYCLYVLVRQTEDKKAKICRDTKLTDYLIELMYDRNYKIKTLCTYTLDLISEENNELNDKIKSEKFNAHNNKWLSMVQMNRSSDESNHMLEDMFIYPDLFLKMDVLCDSSSDNFSDDNLVLDVSNVNNSVKQNRKF